MLKWIKSLFSPSSFKDGPPHNEPSVAAFTYSVTSNQADEARRLSDSVDRYMNDLKVAMGVLARTDTSAAFPATLAGLTDANPKRPSEHFTWHEVACRDKERTLPPAELLVNVYAVADLMERIRSHFGDKAITVNSWYRTPEYNRSVAGKTKSMHMAGGAVDFTVAGLTPRQVQAELATAVKELGIGGLGSYDRFTHVDVGRRRSWAG